MRAYDPEVKAQALALYLQTQSSYQAAELMEDGPEPLTIRRWAHEAGDIVPRMNQERKQTMADGWFEVEQRLVNRLLTGGIDSLKNDQLVVPAAIATDKFHKLTEEQSQQAAPGSYVVVLGNAQIVQQATIKRTE